MPPPELDLSTRQVADHAVVAVRGEVDLETADPLGEHILAAVREVSPHVVLDLSGVSFMDSTGLKVLVTSRRETDSAGGSLRLVAPAHPVRRILALTGLDQALPIHDSVEAALLAASAVGGTRADPDGEALSGGAAPTT